MLARKKILEELKSVLDPELGISIVDLGLIYDIVIDGSDVKIVMTLTSMGCPLFSLIADPIKTKVGRLEGVANVEVELTFDPPWSPDKMNEDAKAQLGFA